MTASLFDRIGDLTAWLAAASIDELELRGPNGSIRLLRANGGVTVQSAHAPVRPAAADDAVVTASMAGIFLDRHPQQDHPSAQVGDTVRAGDILGYLKLGILLVPVLATAAGEVVEAHVAHLAAVGYGEPLFDIEPREPQEH